MMPTEKDVSGKSRWIFVPADCLGLLPFKAEPLSRWRRSNDISRFLDRLATEDLDTPDYDDAPTGAPEHLLKLASIATQLSLRNASRNREK